MKRAGRLLFFVFLGVPILLSAQSWEFLAGPYGGTVRTLASHPDGTLVAGTEGGGVYYSRNDGLSWHEATPELRGKAIRQLVRDAQGTLWAALSYGAVYRSTDGGRSWTEASAGLQERTIWSLFAGSALWAGTDDGLFRYDGTRWIPAGLSGRNVRALLGTPDGLMLAAVPGMGLYRSLDGGRTWPELVFDLRNREVAFLELGNRGVCYLGLYGEGVFRSQDGGRTWTAQNANLNNPYVLSLLPEPDGRLWLGTDGGGVWLWLPDSARWIPTSLRSGAVHALLRSQEGTLLAGLFGAGLYRSPDEGVRWEPAYGGLVATSIRALAFAPDGSLYALAFGTGLFRSADGGRSWTLMEAGLPSPYLTALHVSSGGRVWVGTAGSGLFELGPNGLIWISRAPERFQGRQVRAIASGPRNRIYVSAEGGLYRSLDGGLNWEVISSGPDALALLVLPDGALVAGTASGAYRSLDYGLSWSPAAGVEGRQVRVLAYSARQDRLYAGTEAGLYISADRGISWRPTEVREPILALTLSSSGELFASSWSGQLFVSRDGGESWELMLIPARPTLSALAVAPDGALFLGTEGTGVWRSRERISTAYAEEAPPTPSGLFLEAVYPVPFRQTLQVRFRTDQPSFLRLSFYDLLGRRLAVAWEGGLSAGTHTISWQAQIPAGWYLLVIEDELGRKIGYPLLRLP
nr:MAG: hypothetical protein KatS3mg041_0111 [Bacteroidota bacterium]